MDNSCFRGRSRMVIYPAKDERYHGNDISGGEGESKDSQMCVSAESSSCALQEKVISVFQECNMCGDSGIPEELFQCVKCSQRYQHTYCSRSYPDPGPETSVCNWCLHAEETASCQKELSLKPDDDFPESLEGGAEGRRGSRAFEFLLQIAETLQGAGHQDAEVGEEISDPLDVSISKRRIPRRQRCSHVPERSRVIALDRWRNIAKHNLQLSPPRNIGRRYKLLADVLC